jgi:FtsH-binding integral membrane protein
MLSKKQAEEISYLTKRNEVLKRTRIFNISISGVGLILGTAGYFFRQDEDLKYIGNFMFYTGIGLGSAVVVSFIFTIPL